MRHECSDKGVGSKVKSSELSFDVTYYFELPDSAEQRENNFMCVNVLTTKSQKKEADKRKQHP